MDRLEEAECEIWLRVFSSNAAGNLDELERIDLLLDGGDESESAAST